MRGSRKRCSYIAVAIISDLLFSPETTKSVLNLIARLTVQYKILVRITRLLSNASDASR